MNCVFISEEEIVLIQNGKIEHVFFATEDSWPEFSRNLGDYWKEFGELPEYVKEV